MANDTSLCSATRVAELTSLSASQVRSMARRGEFPAPCRLTPKRVAWVRADVDRWIESKIGGGSLGMGG